MRHKTPESGMEIHTCNIIRLKLKAILGHTVRFSLNRKQGETKTLQQQNVENSKNFQI